jgi:putative membrane-bound dehydrogenase-like protein
VKTRLYCFSICVWALGLFSTLALDTNLLVLDARKRIESPKGSGAFQVEQLTLRWAPRETAIIICDMWDQHWCKGATERVAEMAPRMNEVVKNARERGAFIIHAPSETMEFYKDTPQRKRALDTPKTGQKISRWTRIDPAHEAALPIDDSDGGCDDIPKCKGGPPYPWKRQIATIEIAPEDAISDNGEEVYNLLQGRGIANVIVMGVHANMCVLGRSFAIRQMVTHGKNVALMRDMTDTMYCSRMRPFTNHFRGTDLVVEHIEKYWCPSITSTAFTAKPEFRFKDDPAGKDIAANPAVREYIEKFAGRGQTVEAGRGAKPLSPKESLAHFKVSDGLQIALALAEPDVRQPLCVNFDHRGRMWVVQYLQYPFPAGLKVVKYDEHLRAQFDKVPNAPPNHVPGADKVTIYEDKDGDGYFESQKDFVTGLNIATSALPDHDGVWVMNPPYLLFYPDTNHDDQPDGPPEVHLSGFGLEDTHAVANSLTWGPDGWLYGAQGSTCTATIRGIHFLGQAIWRYHPHTQQFELFAEGGGNTFAMEIDRKGRLFSGTNWGKQRGLYFVQGGYYVKGWGKHGPLTNPHAYGFFPHMPHEGDEARFSHSFVIYEGDGVSGHYFGKMFSIVPLQNRVQVSDVIPDGSSFRSVDTERAIETDDKWFRPVDIKVGPDGAIYLADWYDIRLTHVDPRDDWDRSNGRIYRLAAKDHKPFKHFDLSKMSTADLCGLLTHSNKWQRQQALRLLARRQDSPADLPNGEGALETLWVRHLQGDRRILERGLEHRDPFVRAWSVRLLGDSSTWNDRLLDLARYESDAHVRSQLASSARRWPGQFSLPLVNELAQRKEDLKDPHIPLLLWWAVEKHAIQHQNQVDKLFITREAWKHPIIAKEILPRLARRYAAEARSSDFALLTHLLRAAPTDDERRQVLDGIAEGLRGTALATIPDDFRAEVARIAGEPALKIRLNAASSNDLAAALGLLKEQSDKHLSNRIDVIQAMEQNPQPPFLEPLLQVVQTARSIPARRAALQAVQQFNAPDLGDRLVALLPQLTNELRLKVIDVLSKRKEWADDLLASIEEAKIGATDIPFEIQQRLMLHDRAWQPRIQKIWPRQTATRHKMDDLTQLLADRTGNATRGKELFTATCASCHRLHGEGQTIGPDLSGYERDNLQFWLLAIVEPSAGIREEYVNYELETTDGLLLTGFILGRTGETVTIEDGEQGQVIVPKSKIKYLRASAQSRMPEGLLDTLPPEQIRDLFAYLMSPGPVASGR